MDFDHSSNGTRVQGVSAAAWRLLAGVGFWGTTLGSGGRTLAFGRLRRNQRAQGQSCRQGQCFGASTGAPSCESGARAMDFVHSSYGTRVQGVSQLHLVKVVPGLWTSTIQAMEHVCRASQRQLGDITSRPAWVGAQCTAKAPPSPEAADRGGALRYPRAQQLHHA